MNHHIASVTLDLNRNSRDPNSYSVSIYEIHSECGYAFGRLETRYPVVNGQSTAIGVFETREAAIIAALNHIGDSEIYYRLDDMGLPTGGMRVRRLGDKIRGPRVVVGSKTPRGVFVEQ